MYCKSLSYFLFNVEHWTYKVNFMVNVMQILSSLYKSHARATADTIFLFIGIMCPPTTWHGWGGSNLVNFAVVEG